MKRKALGDDGDPLAPAEEDNYSDPFAYDATGSEESKESDPEESSNEKMTVVEGQVAEDEDEEIDSDEAFGEEDDKRFINFKFPGSRSLRTTSPTDWDQSSDREIDDKDVRDSGSEDSEGEGESMEQSEGDIEMSDTGDSDHDSASRSSTASEPASKPVTVSSDRAALKAILANDTAVVASTLSAAASSDVKKGKAVRQQYQTFDRLLDTRIKLQKALNAANKLPQEIAIESNDRVAIQKAEEAALTLWSTVESLRQSFLSIQPQPIESAAMGKNRKTPSPITTSTPGSELWARMQASESASQSHRRAVLDKWSAKTRVSTALQAPGSQLIDRSSHHQNSIANVLDAYLATESEKLVAAASVFGTAANDVSATQDNEVELPTYDDTSFYQTLLRDLISSRSSNSAYALSSSLSNIVLPSTTKLHEPGSKNKKIDTKASKGRKVRYTVHEKLQNFTAEEERGTWEEGARREFFGSLFGAKRVLDEEEDVGLGLEEMKDGIDGETEALKLFRS